MTYKYNKNKITFTDLLTSLIIRSINFGFKFKEQDDISWIKLREFEPFLRRVLWILGIKSEPLVVAFNVLLNDIKTLTLKSGFNFTFLYLKEVRHIVIRYLAGMDIDSINSKIYIRRDHSGIPKIIPLIFRDILRKKSLIKDRKLLVGILTILSLYRSFHTNPKVDLKTIQDPFSGECQTLDLNLIKKALDKLKVPSYKPFVQRFKFFNLPGLVNRSPNCKISIIGCELDSLAFFCKYESIYLIRLMIFEGLILNLVYFLFLNIVFGPIYMLFRFYWNEKLKMGSLSVVYDQAGKARIIGVSNW